MNTFWQTLRQYEYEVARGADDNMYYTGQVRCVGGRMANGKWPEHNIYTGEIRGI